MDDNGACAFWLTPAHWFVPLNGCNNATPSGSAVDAKRTRYWRHTQPLARAYARVQTDATWFCGCHYGMTCCHTRSSYGWFSILFAGLYFRASRGLSAHSRAHAATAVTLGEQSVTAFRRPFAFTTGFASFARDFHIQVLPPPRRVRLAVG